MYAFLMNPATDDGPGGSWSARHNGNFTLWGPNNGSANGLAPSPTGGYYVAMDADPNVNLRGNGISQSVTGLTVGQRYRLNFTWAAGQQRGWDGPTTEQVQVTFGSQVRLTEVVNNPNHGFIPWRFVTMDFTATSATQTLNFLALGGPVSLPPFVLLDGVAMSVATPEPATVVSLTLGVLTLAGVGLRRRAKANDVVS
jgi:hypothetical protein